MAQFASLWVVRMLSSSPTDGERTINIVASYLGTRRVSRCWRACVWRLRGAVRQARRSLASARARKSGVRGRCHGEIPDHGRSRFHRIAYRGCADGQGRRRRDPRRLQHGSPGERRASGCERLGRTGRGMRHRLRARRRTDGRLRPLSPSRLDGWRPAGRRLPARDASTDRSWGRRGDLGRSRPAASASCSRRPPRSTARARTDC